MESSVELKQDCELGGGLGLSPNSATNCVTFNFLTCELKSAVPKWNSMH